MADKPVLKVKVIHPDKVLFEGEAQLVVAPGEENDLGIFPGHTPMFAGLKKGDIYVKGETEEVFPVESGILHVRDDELVILISPSN